MHNLFTDTVFLLDCSYGPSHTKKTRVETSEDHFGRLYYDMYVASEWLDNVDGCEYMDIMILLPSGVSMNSEYSVKVCDSGTNILFDVKMPNALTDISVLKRITQTHENDITEQHPAFSGFTSWLKINGKSNFDDEIWKHYEIVLTRQVEQKNKFVKSLKLKSGATVVHVRLQILAETYANRVRAENKNIDEAEF